MHRKLQYNSKKHLFVCFTLLSLFTVITYGAPGETFGVCHSASVSNINIATINVYAINDTTEQSVVDGMFVFTRTGNLSSQLTVPFILSGTADNSIDFIPVAESVHFDVGESEKSVYIAPINDAEIEQNETVTLVLSLGVGYILGDHISDTINLSDDEVEDTSVQVFASLDNASRITGQESNILADTLAISSTDQVDLSLEELSVGSASEPVDIPCTTKTETGGHCDIDNSNQLSAVELDGQRNIISVNGNITSIDATQSLKFSGGGSSCRMNTIEWQEPAHNQMLPDPPVDTEYLSGFYFVEYEISACTPGSTLSFTLSYQVVIPADAVLMQYGPTPEKASNHWFEIRTSEIRENTVTYTVTDGQSGDYDLSVNGSIINPIVLVRRYIPSL